LSNLSSSQSSPARVTMPGGNPEAVSIRAPRQWCRMNHRLRPSHWTDIDRNAFIQNGLSWQFLQLQRRCELPAGVFHRPRHAKPTR
jgi:hypothetical protein